jgi:DnaJ-class molecular chaperone
MNQKHEPSMRRKCPDCDGDGYVVSDSVGYFDSQMDNYLPTEHTMACPTCEGTGEASLCHHCQGLITVTVQGERCGCQTLRWPQAA